MNETTLVDKALIQRLQQAFVQLSSVVVGKKEAIRMSLTCLLARGHLLIEDLPGSGKTTLAKAFAATLGLDYRRIQFTADLLPADVVGFSALHPQTHELRFHPGPVFTQLLLADTKSVLWLTASLKHKCWSLLGKCFSAPAHGFPASLLVSNHQTWEAALVEGSCQPY